jgi:ABC-type dipeptide/oligopeptide/nickel transport system permease subunit
MFIALLIGAFFASLAATFGGRRRDAVVYVETDAYLTTASLQPVR